MARPQMWRYGGCHRDLPTGGVEDEASVIGSHAQTGVSGAARYCQRRRRHQTGTSHAEPPPGPTVSRSIFFIYLFFNSSPQAIVNINAGLCSNVQ